MANLLLRSPSRVITQEAATPEEYARDHEFDAAAAVLDGDEA